MSGTDSDIWTNGNTSPALARSAPASTGVGNELAAYRPAPTAGQLAVNGAAAQASESILHKAHRTLRGRYVRAITCGLIGATLGGVWGWFSSPVTYKAEGFVMYEPTVSSTSSNESQIPLFNQFMATRAAMLATPDLVQQALARPEWKDAVVAADAENEIGPASDPAVVRGFSRGLSVYPDLGNYMLKVIYRNEDPDLANGGLAAVLEVAELEHRNSGAGRVDTKIENLRKVMAKNREERRTLLGRLDDLASDFSSQDLAGVEEDNRDRARELRLARDQLDERIAASESALEQVKLNPKQPAQIAVADELMRQYLTERAAIQSEISRMLDRFSERHPMVEGRKNDLARVDGQISEYAAAFQGTTIPDIGEDGEIVERRVTDETVAILKNQRALYDRKIGEIRAEQERVVDASLQASEIRSQVATLDGAIERDEIELQRLESQRMSTGQNFDQGLLASAEVDNDRRSRMAMVGAFGGFAVPMGIFLAMGFFDGRYRYSDDTTAESNGLTLLGILPNLPDRMSDPEQAGIAAHCVHQIRTMLQLQNGVENAQAYAVTSATSGDGKTSLCLAMGLSFAAAGSKTLMIDSDLVGQGLSDRLGLAEAAQFGLMEALAEPHQIDRVTHPTDVDNLALLPIGNAEGAAAGSISPRQMTQLIAEAKKRYDVVLIDTGPILGSIEATPVVASADGVIITVSRGQNKAMVDKALGHLQSVGAKVCGVVFNRAQERDFEQSINGMSIKSISRGGPGAMRDNLAITADA